MRIAIYLFNHKCRGFYSKTNAIYSSQISHQWRYSHKCFKRLTLICVKFNDFSRCTVHPQQRGQQYHNYFSTVTIQFRLHLSRKERYFNKAFNKLILECLMSDNICADTQRDSYQRSGNIELDIQSSAMFCLV